MVTRKNTSQQLYKKKDKLEQALEKIQKQKAIIIQKEKETIKDLTEVKSDLIVALLSETGKSFEELEEYAKSEHDPQVGSSENGDDAHVSDN